ncbi:MAG: O-antigen ligase family protein [Anaerolineales bacterium]
MKANGRLYLWREAGLLLAFAYVVLLGGGFPALIDIRLQTFSMVLAAAVFGGWLLRRLINKARLPSSGLELAFLLFIGSQLIAVIFSEDIRRSIPHSIPWLVYALVFYLVLDLLRAGWPAELFEKCLLIAGTIVIGFALFQWAGLYFAWQETVAGLEFAPGFQQRISGILGDPNLLAAFTNLLIPLAVARAIVSGKASRIVLFGLALAGLIVLLLTDSRGGLLGLGMGLLILVALWVSIVSENARRQAREIWDFLLTRKILLLLLSVAALAALALVAWRQLSFQGDATHAPALSARNIYWQAAANAVVTDPLTGAGPGLFPVELMQIWSTPPARPYLHAHSLPFQIASESGLLGLAAFGFLAATIGRHAWGVWGGLDYPGRARWAAALAALLGLSVHSLVDDFFPFPAVGVVAALLLAFAINKPVTPQKAGGFSPVWLALPALVAGAFTVYALSAYAHADRAVDLGVTGDWQAAASELQAAAQEDGTNAFYWLQAGYVYARLAERDQDFYDEAISAYERGIEIEPHYALNYANLAALYWESRDKTQGLSQMRIATRLAPGAWLFWLNQGVYEESLGQSQEALASYRQSLALKPDIAGAKFWTESELRQASVDEFAAFPTGETARAQASAAAKAGREAVVAGDLVSAKRLLSQAYGLNNQEVGVYIGLGELALGQADFDLTVHYVHAALLIQGTIDQAKTEGVLVAAQSDLAAGNTPLALHRYEIAYNAFLTDASYGWGSVGWSPYAWFVFQRRALPEDLVPQLERADVSVDIAQRLLVLADLYEMVGQQGEAQAVRETLQPYLP